MAFYHQFTLSAVKCDNNQSLKTKDSDLLNSLENVYKKECENDFEHTQKFYCYYLNLQLAFGRRFPDLSHPPAPMIQDKAMRHGYII